VSNESIDAELVQHKAEALAAQLADAGISRLGLFAANSVAWAIVDIACLLGGICLVPIPTFFSVQQREHVLASCALDTLFTDDVGVFPDAVVDCSQPWMGIGEALALLRLRTAPNNLLDVALPPDTGKITFTSGSTGLPKGVCLSHAQLIAQARTLADVVDLAAPKHLCVMPLSTLLENVAGLYAPLLVGGTVSIPRPETMGFSGSKLTDPAKLLRTISEQQPNSMILIPQLLQLLVGATATGWQVPSSLRFVAVGGSKVSASLLQAAHAAGIPVYEGYGLSECASVVSLNSGKDSAIGSCGKPLPGLRVTIQDGEILVAGNSMLGYLNEPDSWNPQLIATGDLGRLEANGFLFIEGRKKNLLISSYGRNISPEWVESELLANPLLGEAVVLGDARPFCVALLWPREQSKGTTAAEVAAQIADWVKCVNAGLPDYARVQLWHQLVIPLQSDSALMTENGRPKREAIAQRYAATLEGLYATASVIDEPNTPHASIEVQ
jgi:long-chain acyl-CoA synthetase